MKKIFAAILAFAMTVSFAACGANEQTQSSAAASQAGSAASSASDTFQIGLVQIMEHTSLNQIRESFEAEMQALGYGPDKVALDYQNAQGDQSNLNSICQKFAGDGKDMIVAIATPSALSAAAAAPKIPLVFSAVTDPVAAKLVQNPEAPEGIITGTSDAIPIDQVFALMKQLTPNVKTVGMIYNLGEINSVTVIDEAKAYCDANGLSYVEATVANTGEVQQAAQSLVGKCDAFYTPIDNTVATAMSVYADVARQAKLPIYTGADSMVIDGGFSTIGVDYVQLGKQTALMAVKVLEGTPVSEVPVETLTNFSTTINTSTAEAIGVTIPSDLLANANVVE